MRTRVSLRLRKVGLLFPLLPVLLSAAEPTEPSVSPPPTVTPTPPSPKRVQLRSTLAAEVNFIPTPRPTPRPLPSVAPRPRLEPGWEVPPTKPSPSPEPEQTRVLPSPDPHVVVLEKIVVEAERDPEIKARIAYLEDQAAWYRQEIATVEDSPLDEVLNHPKLSILGPFSTSNRIAFARSRLSLLEAEIQLLRALQATTDLVERQKIRSMIMELRYSARGSP